MFVKVLEHVQGLIVRTELQARAPRVSRTVVGITRVLIVKIVPVHDA